MEAQASIGSTLRQHREERGLTVEQAAYQSKVPLRLVQALESDDYHLLPDALYLIRLLHDYATFLKLDVAAIEDGVPGGYSPTDPDLADRHARPAPDPDDSLEAGAVDGDRHPGDHPVGVHRAVAGVEAGVRSSGPSPGRRVPGRRGRAGRG